MIKPSFRGSFSDRNKIDSFSDELQMKDFNERTRTRIINFLYDFLGIKNFEIVDDFPDFFEYLFCQIYCLEDKNEDFDNARHYFDLLIRKTIKEAKYNEILDLLTGICLYFKQLSQSEGQMPIFASNYYDRVNDYANFTEEINKLFREEYVGYTLMDDMMIPITNDAEIESIKKSLELEKPFKNVSDHLLKAVKLLSDDKKPDYKNSIKESISSVESMCKIITNDEKSDLGKALNKLKSHGVKIHPALFNAYNALYGYTSDEGGIRHAGGLLEEGVGFEEAQYMLVSCSAFVNYLKGKFSKNGKD